MTPDRMRLILLFMGAHFNWQPDVTDHMPVAEIIEHFKAAQAMVKAR